jgi:hypothetical protein
MTAAILLACERKKGLRSELKALKQAYLNILQEILDFLMPPILFTFCVQSV